MVLVCGILGFQKFSKQFLFERGRIVTNKRNIWFHMRFGLVFYDLCSIVSPVWAVLLVQNVCFGVLKHSKHVF